MPTGSPPSGTLMSWVRVPPSWIWFGFDPVPLFPRRSAPSRAEPSTEMAGPPALVMVLFATVGTGTVVPDPTVAPVARTEMPGKELPVLVTVLREMSIVEVPWSAPERSTSTYTPYWAVSRTVESRRTVTSA